MFGCRWGNPWESSSRAGWADLGIPEDTGPAGAGSLSAWKNLAEWKRPPARARLPALWHSFGGV